MSTRGFGTASRVRMASASRPASVKKTVPVTM
ncbi:hypothetical protein BJ981_001651 [Sphaerisporangium krabiense]|uniref:Uncharacterized protein n=1 Tax=Sphaerisporangium krabiense TaxID=763782 RepID=A0A7W8Z242_9ACTN|nr:hypothetical protein [Sphaerisporangium krabiense]